MFFISHSSATVQFSHIVSTIDIARSPDQRCVVENDRLYINGRFVRYLTQSDRQQLYAYQQQIRQWDENLDTKIQHQVNERENERRVQMNSAFGPQGSFHRAFTGEFWEKQHLSTPPPTTMPLLPAEDTASVRQMPYPDPPAFCNLARFH